MSDDGGSAPESDGPEQVSPESGEEQSNTETPLTAESMTKKEHLPKWAQDELTRARNEAASKRVEAGNAADEARKSVSQEYDAQIAQVQDERASAQADAQEARNELAKLKTALSAGIPGESAVDFASLLQGSTEEELQEHAEKVKGMFAPKADTPVDPRQASGGNGEPDVQPGLARLTHAYTKKSG